MDKEEKVVLELNQKTDLMTTKCECPQCGDRYIHGVPYVQVPCGKCGITYKTDFRQDIYTKKARQLLANLSYHNELTIRADEQYESSLVHMRHHFMEQHCWDVTDIEKTEEEYRRCLKCGVCHNCFTCMECGKPFKRDPNKRKQICPKCKVNKFIKTYFTEVIIGSKSKVCPHCKSDKIKMTRTRNKTKCHKCNSTKLAEKKKRVMFSFGIERKKAYRRENV
jgi:hypothetical protein